MNEFDTPIIHKVLIRADREKVYKAMTTAEGLDGWFTRGTEIDRRSNGKLILRWKDWGPDSVTDQAECIILELDEPNRFVFKWWADHYTTVEMNFEKVKDGTIVSLTETGYEDSVEGHRRCLECATGWGEALTLLKFFVEYKIRY